MTSRIFLTAVLVMVTGFWVQVQAQEATTSTAAEGVEKPAEGNTSKEAGTPEVVSAPSEGGTVVPGTTEDKELTMGEAFLRKLKQGGWTMVFLAACSVFGLAFTIERLVGLRRRVFAPEGLAEKADELWRAGRYDEVGKLAQTKPCTLSRMLAAVARHRHSSMTDVLMIAGDVAARDLKTHMRRTYPLAVVATLSPMLGLLGTVIGMIGAFDKVAAAGSLGDASMLGADISKALITTGAGLVIAVPALAMYHYFRSRVSLFGSILEEEGSDLIMSWYLEDGAKTSKKA